MGDDDEDKPKGLVYSVRDVGAEVLGRVPIQKIPTPKTGVQRPPSERTKRPVPVTESHTALRAPTPSAPMPAIPAVPTVPATTRSASSAFESPSAFEPSRPDTPRPKKRGAVRTEQLHASVEAPRTASEPPPAPAVKSLYDRALPSLKALRASGPGDEGPAVQALLKLGPPILELVEVDFPGLLWFHRHLAHRKLPAGRDIGPLGALLVAFGEPAIPTVVKLIENGSPDARYYAALVASDLLGLGTSSRDDGVNDASSPVSEEARERLVRALAERLFDGDSGVRDVSLHALLAVGRSDALDEVGVRLRTFAVDLGVPLGTRIVSLRALGVLRRGEVVPDVIPLLEDREEQIRENAHRVLRLLTGTDLSGSLWRWRRWWKKHAGRPRAEWLVEGLDGSDAQLRLLCQKELARLVHHEEPLDPEASRAERKRIREVYARLVRDSS
jgi:HEAT repeat protein